MEFHHILDSLKMMTSMCYLTVLRSAAIIRGDMASWVLPCPIVPQWVVAPFRGRGGVRGPQARIFDGVLTV
jgi:hypothetical protein